MRKPNRPQDVFKCIDMKGGSHVECWPWKGKVNAKDGRPYFTIQGKRRPAYAIVLAQIVGPSGPGLVARHSCDNPVCCNPNHLAWGTHQDNMNDMMERERHGINKNVVRAIRKLLKEGRTHQSIADLYGVSRETITAINNGRTHKGIDKAE